MPPSRRTPIATPAAARRRNGRLGTGRAAASGEGAAGAATSASANCSVVANRSAGSFAIALVIAASTAGGTFGRTSRIEGIRSIDWRARITCGEEPANGGSPMSVSYSTQPRL